MIFIPILNTFKVISMGVTNCITVLTARGINEILKTGGSKAWRLNASHAGKCSYVVCVQNSKIDWGTQEAKHHHAFMIGRISGISRIPDHPGKRWIINIDSYAEIDIPNQWDGNRNPVSYRNLEDMGIDLSKLNFKPIDSVEPSSLSSVNQTSSDEYDEYEEVDVSVRPLSLKEAKTGLSLYFGVSEDDIQITIKG